MTPRAVQVTFDCRDPPLLAAFWCEPLGYRLEPPPSGFRSWEAALEARGVPEADWNSRAAAPPDGEAGLRLVFQQVPEAKTVKNRLHLDARAARGSRGQARMAALDAEAECLVGPGATVVRRVEPSGPDHGFVVMQDPEGNEFCPD